jgi:ribosomal protein S18 acetylase RimI-like enzyme
MNMDFRFRLADSADAAVIADFNCRLAWETEQRRLDPELVLAGVSGGLARCPEVRYFVAENDSAIIGQLMLTREWSDWRNGWMIWLQSVYVQADCRRQRVFQRLLSFATTVVQAEDNPVCLRLYVEHNNAAAQACYHSLGFRDAGYLVMEQPLKQPTG